MRIKSSVNLNESLEFKPVAKHLKPKIKLKQIEKKTTGE